MDKMNLALTMRETADKTNADREQTSKNMAEQWVDAVLLPSVKRSAENGEYYTTARVPNNVHYEYATAYLTSMGFIIERMRDRYTHIKW